MRAKLSTAPRGLRTLEIPAYFDRRYRRLYDARLMSGRLPETIDPIPLAEQGVRLTGELPLRDMPRLASANEGMATVDLKFARAPHGLRFLRARIEARLRLVCQRCLQPMEVEVWAEPVLALFRPDEPQAGVPEEAEPLAVGADWCLASWVEDELLLAMPMMPKHAAGECIAETWPPSKARRIEAKTHKPNPFAVLEKLRNRE